MGGQKPKSGPHIYWRNGRAYGDFRSYADVGGGREALSEKPATWATTDNEIAHELFKRRLDELQDLRRGRVGVPTQRRTTLGELVKHHLLMKATVGKTSDSHLEDLEARLDGASAFFGKERDPASISPEEVREWSKALAVGRGGRPSGRAVASRKPGTVRHYLNALSGLFRRAQEGLWVSPGYNPVAALIEKPTGHVRAEARFFEVPDAALLLEAARIVDARERKDATDGFHPIVATFLLTGGRKSEVLGLDIEDVSFDRNLVTFRPNAHRRLKTQTSHRTVPLWPQLRDILQEWMYGGDTPRTSGLLFPSPDGRMVGSLRKRLDRIGTMCGFEAGDVRTRAFRHTYCSARLQTVQRILRPGGDPADERDWEHVEVSKFQVQKEMGHGGARLVDRIYGHAPRLPYRADVVEYRVAQHEEALGNRLRELQTMA